MSKAKQIALPDSVPVAGQTYNVVVVDGLDDVPSSCWGYIDCGSRTIYLTSQFPDGATLLTAYFHEVIHAISAEYRVELEDNDTDRLAPGITQAVIALMEAE